MADEIRPVRTVETGEHKDRVLIVEDEDNARKGYEQLLQRWGYEVLGVGNEDALAKFSTFQPDTLIADVELPGMNGLDLLKQLGDELLDVPAIIITGKGSEERVVAAIESGASDPATPAREVAGQPPAGQCVARHHGPRRHVHDRTVE